MKRVSLVSVIFCLMSCASNPATVRTHYEDYEEQIGFTQVVQHGERLILSGITAPGPDMQLAVDTVYGKITSILKQHGASMGDVVKESLYTTDMLAFKRHLESRRKYYPEGSYPAATWLEVKGLFMPEYVLEVEVEVIIPDSK